MNREKKSSLATHENLRAMVSALRESKCFKVEVDNDAGTVLASHAIAGTVFKAVQKYPKGPWIITHDRELFVPA